MGSLWSLGLYIIIVSYNPTSCDGQAAYVLFPGFETKDVTGEAGDQTEEERDVTYNTSVTSKVVESSTEAMLNDATEPVSVTVVPVTAKNATTDKKVAEADVADSLYKPYVCPEEERPLNIGTYEVPTQKDLVVHMKKSLMRHFKSYHKKALIFLNDIKEATQATSMIEMRCPGDRKRAYRMCVRHVNNQCQVITKTFVTSLERQRHDVSYFNESSICNVSSMKGDPVQLIKTIAMEEASLEFALPGFLRLLGACSVYCQKKFQAISHYWKTPKRHMSDQDLVIKHFLTQKNYAQLIQGYNNP